MKKILFIALLFIATFLIGVNLASGQVAPILVTGNPNCASLGFNRNVKIEPPRAGTTVLIGVGSITATVNSNSTLSFTTTSPAFVRAVIVKGGANANVYLFSPTSLGQDLLATPTGQDISHVDFCYNIRPSAASVSYSGKVTNFYGKPVSGATVSITNGSSGETRSAKTNAFGDFSVDGLPAGNFYIIQATAKGLQFLPIQEVLYESLEGQFIKSLY